MSQDKKKSDDKDYFFVNCNAIIFNERPRCPLTYAVIAVNNVEDFVAGFFITEIVGTDAAEDGRLSQSLPGSVAGLSAMLDQVSIVMITPQHWSKAIKATAGQF